MEPYREKRYILSVQVTVSKPALDKVSAAIVTNPLVKTDIRPKKILVKPTISVVPNDLTVNPAGPLLIQNTAVSFNIFS